MTINARPLNETRELPLTIIMNDLLSYYHQELTFIRKLAAEFALAHPKIAGRLKLDEKNLEDPHVARLIEAFALLNARLRCKLDDDFPELLDGLFNVIYPHYNAPIPSISILQLQPQLTLQEAHTIPPNTIVKTNEMYGEECLFKTIYPVELLPLSIEQISLTTKPFMAPIIPEMSNAATILRISLNCTADGISLAQLAPQRLRFFLNLPAPYNYQLYELLFNHLISIAFATSPHDQLPIVLSKNNLQPVGFKPHEGLLPYPANSFLGYRLLTELFIFPEKFLFFDLINLEQRIWQHSNQRLEIYLYLNRTNDKLTKQVSNNSLAFGCTPIVNLFEEYAEPIKLTHFTYEYPIIPQVNHLTHAREIYAIQQVTGIKPSGEVISYQPFYGIKHHTTTPQLYWYASRKAVEQEENYRPNNTTLFLSVTDNNFSPMTTATNENWIINVKLLCTNHNKPNQLPFGGNDPLLSFWEYPTDTIKSLRCIVPMTPSYHPHMNKSQARWQIIAHLSLNHLSLTNEQTGTDTLKEILTLYNFNDADDVKNMIDGILNLQARPKTTRNTNTNHHSFWHGTEIILTVDETKFSGVGLFLFASVLEYFLSLYATINSFTQLVVTTKNRGEIYRWSPRAGEKTLL